MRVIDLLNKIANGKEVPKKLCFWEREYIYDKEYNCYLHQVAGNEFIDLLDNNNDDLQSFLNDEVEILDNEEKEKPLTKKDVEALGYACGEIKKCFENGWNKSLENKPFKEDNKIEKLEVIDWNDCIHDVTHTEKKILIEINKTQTKLNEIIDYLMEDNK